MARSIHDTWGVMAQAVHSDWADPAARDTIVAEMRKNIHRQRRIRESERRLRRQGAIPPQPVQPDSLPIFVDDAAPYMCARRLDDGIADRLGDGRRAGRRTAPRGWPS